MQIPGQARTHDVLTKQGSDSTGSLWGIFVRACGPSTIGASRQLPKMAIKVNQVSKDMFVAMCLPCWHQARLEQIMCKLRFEHESCELTRQIPGQTRTHYVLAKQISANAGQ